MDRSRRRLVTSLVIVEIVIAVAVVRLIATPFGHRHHELARSAASARGHHGAVPRTFSVASAPLLVIDDDSSTFEIVSAEATATAISVDDGASDGAHALRIVTTPSVVTIGREHASTGKTSWHFGWSTSTDDMASPRVVVRVPAGVRIDAKAVANLTITGHRGDVAATLDSGTVAIADIDGSIDVASSNGRVVLDRVRGERIAVAATNGRITLRGTVAGAYDVRTDNGRIDGTDVAFRGAAPNGSFTTSNGAIAIGGSFPENGKYIVRSENGRIAFSPQAEASLTIDAHTENGSVNVSYPNAVVTDRDDAKSRTVRIGAGTGAVELATSNSRITIAKNGAS